MNNRERQAERKAWEAGIMLDMLESMKLRPMPQRAVSGQARLVNKLVKHGLVEKNGTKYELTPKMRPYPISAEVRKLLRKNNEFAPLLYIAESVYGRSLSNEEFKAYALGVAWGQDYLVNRSLGQFSPHKVDFLGLMFPLNIDRIHEAQRLHALTGKEKEESFIRVYGRPPRDINDNLNDLMS